MYNPGIGKMVWLAALTYIRRPIASLGGVAEIISAALLYAMGLQRPLFEEDKFNLYAVLGIAMVALTLVRHWKQQIVFSIARLWPHFRLIHTVIFLFLLAFFTAIPSGLIWLRSGTYVFLLNLIVQLLVLLTVLGMIGVSHIFFQVMFYGLFVLSLIFYRLSGQVAQFFLANSDWLLPVMLTMELACLVWMIQFIYHSTEESRCYTKDPFVARDRNATSGVSTQQNDSITQWLLVPVSRQIQSAQQQRTIWQRVRRWDIGGWNIRHFYIFASSGIIGSYVFGKYFSRDITIACLISYSFVLPSFMLSTLIKNRIIAIQSELVLPVKRHHYYRQKGAALALSYLWMWLEFTVVQIIGLWLVAPDKALTVLATTIPLSLSLSVLYFGCLAWLALISIRLPSILLCMLFGLSPGLYATAGRGIDFHLSLIATTSISMIACIVGILATYDAYCRWLNVEVSTIGFDNWLEKVIEGTPVPSRR